ncbi:MAG: TfoX/Sxy family protein [Clostridia bacterium]|nr:TfoX/Sxy family protein [Clostridia bacterium]
MSELRKLPNIGGVADDLLVRSGIDTIEKLMNIGSKEAFLKIRMQDPTACLHMLYGIEGAVQGIRDVDLSAETKTDLKAFFRSL